MATGDKHRQGPANAAHTEVAVTDTGNAAAVSGATAVTGYQGPVPGTEGAPAVPVRISDSGNATASEGGLANTGYIHHVSVGKLTMVHGAPREPAPWPHQVGVIPSRARSFQHRAEAERLRATVDGGGTAVLGQVLTGMGGVGKTQLAADYARTAWEDGSRAGGLDVLVWLNASSREAIVSGYAQAGIELCRADPSDPEKAASSFLAWLTPKAAAEPCRWLIVLDDIGDPDHVSGLWPPANPHGRTLATTRRRDAALAGDGRRTVEVGLFTEDEALTYLTASLAAHSRAEPADQLIALAGDLGHLPLALAQAVAYLVDSGEDIATYRRLLADRTSTLADTAPDRLPDDQTLPLAAAWSLSIDRADTLRPAGLARPMLQLTSMLDANGIPHDVLTGPAALNHLAAHRMQASPDTTAEQAIPSLRDAKLALRALHRLSLIDHTPDTPNQAVRVHQLIQRTTRDALTPRQYGRIAYAAADALMDAWPVIERDTAVAQTLRANATALAACAEDALYRPEAHAVLDRTGRSYGQAGQVTAARDHYQRLTDTARRRLGPDHPRTFAARSNLANWRGEAGDAAGAATAFAELLADQRRVLGEDYPGTLTTRSNLASSRGRLGDAAGAATALAELLADQRRVLGEDHPDTLVTRMNLAYWRGEAGDAAGAAVALADLLEHTVRVLGEDHPDTLATRMNLARWQGRSGNAAGAAAALADLLEHMVRVLGEDHPDTLAARVHLARWQGEAGDAAGAATAFTDLLEHTVRVLGEDHPDTLAARGNLAYLQGEAGDAAGAATAFADLLEQTVRVLGEDHPETIITRGNLARWQGEAGDAAGAATAFADLLEQMVRVLGEDHPHTFTTRQELARWRGEAGDAAGAATAFAGLLEQMVKVLGKDHPHTLTARSSLARWQGEAGDAAGAATAFAELLADGRRVLGEDHPKTLTTRISVAYWRGRSRDAALAATAFADLLEQMVRVLGEDHRDTLVARGNLAYWRGEAGDPAGAAAIFTEVLEQMVRVLGEDHPDTRAARINLAHWRDKAGERGPSAGT
ncbi:tetratricopeptide repeat protein [Streptomyces sp. NPDC056773]|uniref:tetratricopeptide repeat protein n=1 Tax=unclassified Streptomyces TaxID=2593676 RepID=UPI0036AB4636